MKAWDYRIFDAWSLVLPAGSKSLPPKALYMPESLSPARACSQSNHTEGPHKYILACILPPVKTTVVIKMALRNATISYDMARYEHIWAYFQKGMDKETSNLYLDTKIPYHILRYASVSKPTKIHIFLMFFNIKKHINLHIFVSKSIFELPWSIPFWWYAWVVSKHPTTGVTQGNVILLKIN